MLLQQQPDCNWVLNKNSHFLSVVSSAFTERCLFIKGTCSTLAVGNSLVELGLLRWFPPSPEPKDYIAPSLSQRATVPWPHLADAFLGLAPQAIPILTLQSHILTKGDTNQGHGMQFWEYCWEGEVEKVLSLLHQKVCPLSRIWLGACTCRQDWSLDPTPIIVKTHREEATEKEVIIERTFASRENQDSEGLTAFSYKRGNSSF